MLENPSIQLQGRTISANEPCYIIAEIGVNHNGDLDIAHRMIDAAIDAGADAVKFQTYRTDDLVLDTAPKANYQQEATGSGGQSEMLRRLELPFEDFVSLRRHCVEGGIDFMSTAFDPISLDAVIGFEPICLKWPSGELNNVSLLKQAARSGFPVMLSTGMGSLAEIAAALDVLSMNGCDDIVILQCVSQYPARIEDQNLRVLPAMSQAFGRPVGFSDHTIGPYAALAARALGMSVLEKHFTLDRSMEGPDHTSSIEPEEFGQLVNTLRAIETGLGDGVKRPVAAEENTKSVARKSLVFRNDLPQGHQLSEDDFLAKRPGSGIGPEHLLRVVGLKLSKSVERDEMFNWEHVR